jgi:hypothetical protein
MICVVGPPGRPQWIRYGRVAQIEDGEHRLPTDRIGLADLGLNVDAVATERQLEDPPLLRRVARLREGRLPDPCVDIFCARLERVQFGDEEGG